MTLNTFSGGVNENFSSQLNSNFTASGSVAVLYAGTSFNVTVSGASISTASVELDDITSADLGSSDYISIEIFGTHFVRSDENTNTYTAFEIYTKELGGTYVESLPSTEILTDGSTGSTRPTSLVKSSFLTRWIHTLTANEKSSGVKVKIVSRAESGDAGGAGSFTNIQTVVRPLA